MAEKKTTKKTTKKETPKKSSGIFNITKANGNVIVRENLSDAIKATYESKGWKVEEV